MPTPLHENEEFEFRARAEQEASAPPQVKTEGAAPQQSWGQQAWETAKGVGNEAVRAGSQAITGLPTMVADVPVAVGNLIKGKDKSGNYPYELPSAGQERRLDAAFPPPASTAGKASEAVSSLLMGGGAGAARRSVGMLTASERAAQALPKPLKNVSPQVRALADKGVTMTPGDIKGGGVRNFEDKLTALPFVGNIIKNAKAKSVAQFQEATINDSLKEIGQSNTKGLAGHEAIRQAGEKFSQAYDDILPKMKGDLNSTPPAALPAPGGSAAASAPTSFRGALDQIKTMVASSTLDPAQQAKVNAILDKDIISKFTSSGKASGETLQSIRETLRGHIEDYQKSTNPGDRTVGKAIEFAREAMDDMVERENPALSKQYSKLRNGYAQYKIAERAGAYKGAKEGIPTASQYMGAVRAQDASKDHSAFAKGTARQQKLGEAGEAVLGNREPDSGTAGRLGAMDVATGGAAAIMQNPLVLGAMGSVPFLYSQAGLKGLQVFLLGGGKRGAGLAAGAAQGAAAAIPGQLPGADQAGIGQ